MLPPALRAIMYTSHGPLQINVSHVLQLSCILSDSDRPTLFIKQLKAKYKCMQHPDTLRIWILSLILLFNLKSHCNNQHVLLIVPP